jgi:hypothetical protein
VHPLPVAILEVVIPGVLVLAQRAEAVLGMGQTEVLVLLESAEVMLERVWCHPLLGRVFFTQVEAVGVDTTAQMSVD